MTRCLHRSLLSVHMLLSSALLLGGMNPDRFVCQDIYPTLPRCSSTCHASLLCQNNTTHFEFLLHLVLLLLPLFLLLLFLLLLLLQLLLLPLQALLLLLLQLLLIGPLCSRLLVAPAGERKEGQGGFLEGTAEEILRETKADRSLSSLTASGG